MYIKFKKIYYSSISIDWYFLPIIKRMIHRVILAFILIYIS